MEINFNNGKIEKFEHIIYKDFKIYFLVIHFYCTLEKYQCNWWRLRGGWVIFYQKQREKYWLLKVKRVHHGLTRMKAWIYSRSRGPGTKAVPVLHTTDLSSQETQMELPSCCKKMCLLTKNEYSPLWDQVQGLGDGQEFWTLEYVFLNHS